MKICPKCGRHATDDLEICPNDGVGLLILPEEDEGSLVGRVLDRRYRIDRVLGRGGMGIVYQAHHLLLERDVAVKVMRRDFAADVTLIKRFFVEAKATSSLEHPNIITLYDFGQTTDGLLYLSMEYLEGVPLNQEIRRRRGLPLEELFPIAAQICDALGEAHRRGILHRDLKPENVFLIQREGALWVKVLDFGIARLLKENTATRLTDTGAIYGTPHYLSPEQASGAEASVASDLYALGVIVYEMLTGLPPFHAEKTPIGILAAHASRPPPRLAEIRPDLKVPEPLEHFLEQALAKVAYLRSENAAAFRRELDEVSLEILGSGTAPLMADGGKKPHSPAGGEVGTRSYATGRDPLTEPGQGHLTTLAPVETALQDTLPAPAAGTTTAGPFLKIRPRLVAPGLLLATAVLAAVLWAAGVFRTESPTTDLPLPAGTTDVWESAAPDITPEHGMATTASEDAVGLGVQDVMVLEPTDTAAADIREDTLDVAADIREHPLDAAATPEDVGAADAPAVPKVVSPGKKPDAHRPASPPASERSSPGKQDDKVSPPLDDKVTHPRHDPSVLVDDPTPKRHGDPLKAVPTDDPTSLLGTPGQSYLNRV